MPSIEQLSRFCAEMLLGLGGLAFSPSTTGSLLLRCLRRQPCMTGRTIGSVKRSASLSSAADFVPKIGEPLVSAT